MRTDRISGLAPTAAVAIWLAANCVFSAEAMPKSGAEIAEAVAVIQPTEGNKVKGVVRFIQMEGKVTVLAEMEGLAPNTKHGFHVHEFGDFSSPDAASAGGHYNPEGLRHGGPPDPNRHAGDLGNVEADENGKARLELVVDNISIAGARNPIIGRGLVVHAGEDDLKTQPTGNSGARVGFAVIGIAKPNKAAEKREMP